MKIAVAILVAILWATGAYAQSTSSWYRNEELRIAFAYGPRWKVVEAAEGATLQVVNWYGKEGGLVATCYLQTYKGGIGKLFAEQLHTSQNEIAASLLQNARKRYPVAKLISSESLFVDGLPVVFLIREAHGTNFGETVDLKTWIIVTSWLGREINFECGSTIPFRFAGNSVVEEVEKEIIIVMKTLHFER